MYKTILIIGCICIWLIFPILTGLLLILLLSPLSNGSVGFNRFISGVIVSAALGISFTICKLWKKLCVKVWKQPNEEDMQIQSTPIANIWVCQKCGTKNSTNYAQCKKCGIFRGQ